MDIFFTHSYQYVLYEDAGSVASRLVSAFSKPGSGDVLLAENGFRLGHPLVIFPGGGHDTQLAYLSGSLDAMAPIAIPSLEPGGAPEYRPRTLIDIRIRPNVFLVVLAYLVAIFMALDLLGIELFWKTQYLWRLGMLCLLGIGSVWAIFHFIGSLKRKFEERLISSPTQ